MTRAPRHLIVLGLILALALTVAACGDDESTAPSGATGAAGGAAVPAAATAFDGLATSLEAEGIAVAKLPPSSLNGAESGVSMTGDKTGTALLFASSSKAEDYAKEASGATTIVGTAVFESTSQEDADFFADAYEGG